MNTGFEVFDLRELHILRTLTDEELADVKAVHIYGSDRKSNEGLSALYITKNDEVFLAGFDSLVGNSGLEKMPDVRFLKRSVKVQVKSVLKIVVGAEFGAALSTSNDLYLWGCDVGTGLTQLAFECYYDGSSCSKCNTRLTTLSSKNSTSWCNKCNEYKNRVSTIPHPAGWRGKVLTVLGRAATGTQPPIPKLFCVSCGVYRQATYIKFGNFTVMFCGVCGHPFDSYSLVIPPQTNSAPHKVTLPYPLQVQDIAAGRSFLLLRTPSELIIWGYLGSYWHNFAVQNPDKVVFRKVACGSDHIAVISDKGDLYTVGRGDKGQLGYTPSASDGSMALKKVSLKEPAVDVACGVNSTVCLLQNGKCIVYGNITKIFMSGTSSLNSFDVALITVPSAACYENIIEPSLNNIMQPGGKRSAVLTGDLADTYVHLFGLKCENPDSAVGELCAPVHDASSQTDLELSNGINSADSNFQDNGSKTESKVQVGPSHTRSCSCTSLHQSADLFGQLLLSDLTLMLSDGDFPVHCSVLYASSVYFRKLFTDSEPPKVLDMSSYNATAYRGMVQYFYGVPLGLMAWEDMFDLAMSYNEVRIAADVLSKLKNSIDNGNVLSLHDRAKAANATELLEERLTFIDSPDFKKSLIVSFTQDRNSLLNFYASPHPGNHNSDVIPSYLSCMTVGHYVLHTCG